MNSVQRSFPPPSPIQYQYDPSYYGAPPSGNRASMNNVVALSIVVIIGAFLLISCIKFYHVCFSRRPVIYVPSTTGSSSRRNAEARPPKGLQEAVVASFPVIVYSAEREDYTECVVCLGDYEDKEPLKQLPSCRHAFHPECIGTWLKDHTTCPLCRTSLLPEPSMADQALDRLRNLSLRLSFRGHPGRGGGAAEGADGGDGGAGEDMEQGGSGNGSGGGSRSMSTRGADAAAAAAVRRVVRQQTAMVQVADCPPRGPGGDEEDGGSVVASRQVSIRVPLEAGQDASDVQTVAIPESVIALALGRTSQPGGFAAGSASGAGGRFGALWGAAPAGAAGAAGVQSGASPLLGQNRSRSLDVVRTDLTSAGPLRLLGPGGALNLNLARKPPLAGGYAGYGYQRRAQSTSMGVAELERAAGAATARAALGAITTGLRRSQGGRASRSSESIAEGDSSAEAGMEAATGAEGEPERGAAAAGAGEGEDERAFEEMVIANYPVRDDWLAVDIQNVEASPAGGAGEDGGEGEEGAPQRAGSLQQGRVPAAAEGGEEEESREACQNLLADRQSTLDGAFLTITLAVRWLSKRRRGPDRGPDRLEADGAQQPSSSSLAVSGVEMV